MNSFVDFEKSDAEVNLDLCVGLIVASHRWRQVAQNYYVIDAKLCTESEFKKIEKKYQLRSKL